MGDGARTLVPPDVATCDECIGRGARPADRRYRYPFTNCTNCGPRFTIIRDLPYDRPTTTMAGFAMCPACRRRVRRPRRPSLPRAARSPARRAGRAARSTIGQRDRRRHRRGARGRARALRRRRASWRSRASVATTSRATPRSDVGAAFAARAQGPLATSRSPLMVPDLAAAARSGGDRRRGSRGARCRRRGRSCCCVAAPDAPVSSSVAPGNPLLGVMLPYTPLHHLLFAAGARRATPRAPRALVLTSGNLSNEPICIDDADARDAARATWPTRSSPTTGRSTCRATTRWSASSTATCSRCAARAGTRPLPVALPVRRGAHAGRRRRAEEHVLRRRRSPRLGQPAHRRHGEPRDAARVRANRRRRSSGCTRVAADAWSRRIGTPATSRAGGPSSTAAVDRWSRCSTTTRTSPSVMAEHGLDGTVAGDRHRVRRHRLRHRRRRRTRDLGRRGARRRLRRLRPRRAPAPAAAARAATARVRNPCRIAVAYLAALGVAARRVAAGRRRLRRRGAGGRAPPGASATSGACRPPAWAACSTPSRRCSGVRHRIAYEAQAAIELEVLAERGTVDPAASPWAFGARR